MKKFLIALFLIPFVFVAIRTFAQQGYNVYDNPEDYRVQTSGMRENVLIILDCSLSMEDKIRGRRKIDVAKEVINKVIAQLPGNVHVGLRAYGHKRNQFKSLLGFDECEVSDLLVPIGTGNRNQIHSALSGLDAIGWTPICYSIGQSVEHDFVGLPGKKRIILVSDGMETCNGSPCEFAVDLVKKDVNVAIDVIGFDLSSDPEAISQLRCAALVTNGKFYTADNPEDFLRSLQDSFSVTTEVQGMILSK